MKTRSPLVVAIVASVLSFASGGGAASPAPPAKVVIPPWVDDEALPAFDAEPFPQEKSSAPKPSEWKDVPRVQLSRKGISGCNAYRLREWIKIHCETRTAGMRLLAGSTDGIALWVAEAITNEANPDPTATMGRNAELIFPVRPGDRRVFEIFDLSFDDWGGGFGTRSSQIVEELWAEGADKPMIAQRAR